MHVPIKCRCPWKTCQADFSYHIYIGTILKHKSWHKTRTAKFRSGFSFFLKRNNISSVHLDSFGERNSPLASFLILLDGTCSNPQPCIAPGSDDFSMLPFYGMHGMNG